MPRSGALAALRHLPLRGWMPVAFPFALVTVAWWPSTQARFGLIDDHQIIKLLAGRPRLPVSEVVPQIVAHRTEPLGRSRPLYWVGQVLESAWAGDRPLLWYLDRLVLVLVTLAALLYLCRLFVGPWAAALLAPAAVLGPQFEAWSRLGAAEAYAMPLFVVGTAATVRGWRARDERVVLSGATALLAAALAKESFLVFAAAGLVVSFVLVRHGPLTRYGWLVWGALAGVFVADLGVLAHQLAEYGSQYSQKRTLASAFSTGAYALANAVLYQAVLGVLLVVLARAGRERVRPPVLIWAVSGAVLVSQVGFYAGADQVGRYLLPGTVASMGLWLGVLSASGPRRSSRPWLPLVVTVAAVLGFSLALGALVSFREARENARGTQHFQAWLHGVEREIVADEATVVVVQPESPYRDLEPVLAVAQYLKDDLPVHVMTTRARVAPDERARALAREIGAMSKRGTPDGLLDPLDPGARCVAVVLGSSPPVCEHAVTAPWQPASSVTSPSARPGDKFSP